MILDGASRRWVHSVYLDELMSDRAVLAELGRRLARHRLERGWTQTHMGAVAGVGQATVKRFERGESVQVTSLLRMLRALGLLGSLDVGVPASLDPPFARFERERRRARSHRGSARSPVGEPST
jgi:transcriptional regulator with XRE-family HTH domain